MYVKCVALSIWEGLTLGQSEGLSLTSRGVRAFLGRWEQEGRKEHGLMATATGGHPKLWAATPKARSLRSCNCPMRKERSLEVAGGRALQGLTPLLPGLLALSLSQKNAGFRAKPGAVVGTSFLGLGERVAPQRGGGLSRAPHPLSTDLLFK